MRTLRSLLLASVGAAAVGAPILATADSGFGPSTASADLDFEIIIPDYIYLSIGDPTAGNVDLVSFTVDPLVTYPGSGTAVASPDTVDVTVVSNSNNVTIGAASTGSLGSIPFTDILITGGGTVPVPAINGADSAAMDLGAAAGLTLTDTWSFSYTNTTAFAPGTYGGAGVGTVMFTATAL